MEKIRIPFYKFLYCEQDEDWAKLGYNYIGHLTDLFSKPQIKELDLCYRWYVIENEETGDKQVFCDEGNSWCHWVAPYDLVLRDCIISKEEISE